MFLPYYETYTYTHAQRVMNNGPTVISEGEHKLFLVLVDQLSHAPSVFGRRCRHAPAGPSSTGLEED